MLDRTNSWILAFALFPYVLLAQQPDPAKYFDAPNLAKQFGTTAVIPFFTGKNDQFLFHAADGKKRNIYYLDPANKKRRLMTDISELAQKLEKLIGERVDTAGIALHGTGTATDKPVASFVGRGISSDKGVVFSYKNTRYLHEFETGKVVPVKKTNATPRLSGIGISPNNNFQLYSKAHQLYLRRFADSAVFPLSKDAALYYSFHLNDDDADTTRESTSKAVWIGNSAKFYVVRKDRRLVGTMSVVHTLMQPRPRLETYKYELPADKEVTRYELFIGDANSQQFLKVNTTGWKDQELEVVYAGKKIFFLRSKRTRDEVELCSVDTATGQVKVLIHEVSKPFINEDLFNVSILEDGKEILWWSDRTGWGHYYLYDENGRLKNAVTSGAWTAGKIIRVDTSARKIFFYGYGEQPNVHPYYAFAYSVQFSGKLLKLLTPENATHQVFMGPSGKYFVDNFSRIDLDPVTVVRSTSGEMAMEAWKPDMSRLYGYGWKHPEMFRIKAADGVTDLYGLMWKPFNFDSTKKYPVISQVYPGPQTETVWTEFTVLDRYNNTSLAQSGFVVVCMGHRGGSPYRGKAYHSYGYGNLRDYALEDDLAGLRQLAVRHSFLDTTRVGIFGHSGGGMMAVAALCTYPDFYKAAVASSGNHDNRIYNRTWGETYQGTDSLFAFTVKLNQALAPKLKGKLLLVTGEVDANVHPGNTYRLVNELIKADKQFDMLVLPGQSHAYEGVYKTYFQQRMRQYFLQHL